MSKLIVKGFIPFSLVDWDRPSSVIFLGGCNYKCETCHNKHLEEIESISFNYIINEILKYSKMINSVVISGGEPLLQNITYLVKLLKYYNFSIKVDTNGFSYERIASIIDYVDSFHIDIKCRFEDYPKIVGVELNYEIVKKTFTKIFELAEKYPSKFLFRTTKIPSLTDTDISYIKSIIPKQCKFKLQEYGTHGTSCQRW